MAKNKSKEIVRVTENNSEVKFKMELSQQDLMEAAVSQKEEEYYGKLSEMRNEIKAVEKEIKEAQEFIDLEARKIFESKHKETLNNIESLLNVFNKGLKMHYSVDRINYDEGIITYTISIRGLSNRSYYNSSNNLSINDSVILKWNSAMKRVSITKKELDEQLKKLREDEYQLNEKLGNIDRLLRRAKAAITKKALENSGLTDLIPQLPDSIK
jgi:hypothetical protein